MPSFGEVQKNNTSLNLSFVPIAIFAGGTSGIGRATAEAFAHSIQGNAHIILLGRNKTAAANILSNLPKPSLPGAVHEFVECDLSLMKNVEEVTNNLRSRLPRLNYLVLSSGTLNFYGRDETTEGIDKKLAVAYYARWKLIQGLTSLLQKAKDEGQDASVLSVLAPTSEGRIDFDDLGLKKNYGASTYMSSSATYNDLMLEAFSERNPELTFTHIYPGIVRTPLLGNIFTHWALAPVNWVLNIVTYPFSLAPERNQNGDDIGKSIYSDSKESRDRLWEHTEKEIQRAIGLMTQITLTPVTSPAAMIYHPASNVLQSTVSPNYTDSVAHPPTSTPHWPGTTTESIRVIPEELVCASQYVVTYDEPFLRFTESCRLVNTPAVQWVHYLLGACIALDPSPNREQGAHLFELDDPHIVWLGLVEGIPQHRAPRSTATPQVAVSPLTHHPSRPLQPRSRPLLAGGLFSSAPTMFSAVIHPSEHARSTGDSHPALRRRAFVANLPVLIILL
ncbi:hypothetical protein NLI96_g2949 [Meripilus lineatus]|uniref:Uncharacterized protein n=1 Tax=Meripilus lineatus TaxID=2056292 RepID=A0AAD5YH21_9APHY|nr:hypothetical protein NLI96_g2949 [Physisporinus lineatus]